MAAHTPGESEAGEPSRALRVGPAQRMAGWALIGAAVALVVSYWLPWYHLYPSNGPVWPPVDGMDPWYPISTAAGSGQSDTLLVLEVALFFPVVVAAATGLVSLTAQRWASSALGGLSIFIGLVSLLACYVLYWDSGWSDSAVTRSVDAGMYLGIVACAVIAVAGLVLVFSAPAPQEEEEVEE